MTTNKVIKIILTQHMDRDDGTNRYRIAKLIGAISVETFATRGKQFYVGDVVAENIAKDLASAREHEVTVTQQKE